MEGCKTIFEGGKDRKIEGDLPDTTHENSTEAADGKKYLIQKQKMFDRSVLRWHGNVK